MGGKNRGKNKKTKKASRQRRRNFQRSLSNEHEQARQKQKELKIAERKAKKRLRILLRESREQQQFLRDAMFHHGQYVRNIIRVHNSRWPLLRRIEQILDKEFKAIERRTKKKLQNPEAETTSDEEDIEEILEWILNGKDPKEGPKRDDQDPDAGLGVVANA